MGAERAFQIVAGLSWSEQSMQPTKLADELVMAVREALPVTGVGLVWMSDGFPGALVAATDERARRVEELQFTLGEGPCTRGAVTGLPVLVDDLRLANPWPDFTAGAVDAGVVAAFAFPLLVGRTTFGVLDLYRDTPGPLLSADLVEAAAFATVSTWVLLHLRPGLVDERLFPDVTERLADRFAVYEAITVLAAAMSVSAADAWNALRTQAVAEQRPVGDVADDVRHAHEPAGL